MVATEGDPDQQHKNNVNPFSSLGRQSSIYSLTLDEFQHTLCESGKNFGSMNMDEFLTSIWTAEENQATNTNNTTTTTTAAAATTTNSNNATTGTNISSPAVLSKQPSLPLQGSLTLPAPLCRKTVEEVWSEIHGDQNNSNSDDNNGDNVQNPESAPRQPTFGEMTLEDFLVRAGVVREQSGMLPASQTQPQQQQFGVYQNNNPAVGPTFVNRPMMGLSTGAESSGYAGNSKTSTGGGGYPTQRQRQRQPQPQPPPPLAVCFGGRVMNGGGGYGAAPAMGVVAPVSPVSSDGMCTSTQIDNSANQFELDMGGLRGRKRIIDGPVEKVVERRQRRMIKNRESAARSRARKQAYTVELEAELNQLREENANLKQALEEIERKRKQQYFEETKTKVQTKAQKSKERLRVLRRNLSCPL